MIIGLQVGPGGGGTQLFFLEGMCGLPGFPNLGACERINCRESGVDIKLGL